VVNCLMVVLQQLIIAMVNWEAGVVVVEEMVLVNVADAAGVAAGAAGADGADGADVVVAL
jgi:hypothetical protein